MDFLNHLLNFILPPRCQKCGTIIGSEGLCAQCFSQITFITEPYCQKCGRPLAEAKQGQMLCPQCLREQKSPFRYSRSALIYDEESKPLILGLKFYDKTENAGYLSKLLYQSGKDIWASGVDVLIPVPLHYTRLIKRRYNQASLLAQKLSHLIGIEVDNRSLVRYRKTKPQVEFSGKARLKNVKGAFRVIHPEKIVGKKIVLIDDVMTTGSTLKECALVLLQAGAKSVDTLTVARVI